MFQDTYIATGDERTQKLGTLYAAVLTRFNDSERLFAAVKQARGERVAMHSAPYDQRELNFEVAHLRLYLAVYAMHALLQPLWDEAQVVRRLQPAWHPTETTPIRQNNIITAEELYDLGCALYWEYRIAHYDVHHWQVERVFRMQDAEPDCFLYEHEDPALEELTAKVKPLHEQYVRLQALAEAIKRAKSNRVQRTDDNVALYLDRERRYEASIAAYRHCVMPLHSALEPLFRATHTVRSLEKTGEFVDDQVALRRLCIAAAEGLYKRVHAAFYTALAEPQEYTATAEQLQQVPANPRVFIMRDGVELDKPLPPPPYQTRQEAVTAGIKWTSWAEGYSSSYVVDSRDPKATKAC